MGSSICSVSIPTHEISWNYGPKELSCFQRASKHEPCTSQVGSSYIRHCSNLLISYDLFISASFTPSQTRSLALAWEVRFSRSLIYTGIQNQELLQHQQHHRILQAQTHRCFRMAGGCATRSTLLWTARETRQKQKVASSFETTPQRNRGPPTWQCWWGKRYFKPVGFGYQIYPNLRPDEIHGQSMSKQHQSHPTHNL